MQLNGNFAISPETWLGSENEAVVRDIDGDEVLTWPEWWVQQTIFDNYAGWLAVNNTNVTLQTFTDAGDSAALQQYYDLDNDTWVPFEDYLRVQASLKTFQLMCSAGTVVFEKANLYKFEFTDYQWNFFDADADGEITEAEWINGNLRIYYDAQMAYEADLAALVTASDANDTHNFTQLDLEGWLAIGGSEVDFTWRDMDLSGVLEAWEYEVTLFEHNEWILLSADGTAPFTLTAFETAYPAMTTDWSTLFDKDADAAISLDEWKGAMTFWHGFWFSSKYDESITDYVTELTEQQMAQHLGIS